MIVPYISDDDLHHKAEAFLTNYNADNVLPVPIEEIAESKLDLMILPIVDLEVYCEIAGTMSKDFKTILIDQKTYETQEARARFTVAHEVGHYILHKELFEKANGNYSFDDFIQFQNSLSNDSYKRLEIQAFRFGEGILFPREQLNQIVTQSIDRLGGTNSLVVTDLESLIQDVSSMFGVSGRATFNKIKRDFPSVIETAMSNVPF